MNLAPKRAEYSVQTSGLHNHKSFLQYFWLKLADDRSLVT